MNKVRYVALLAVLLIAVLPTVGCRSADAATYGTVAPYTRCPIGGTLIVQPMGDSITAGPVTDGGWRALVLSFIASERSGSIGAAGVVDSQGDLNNVAYGYSAATTGTGHSGHSGSSAQQWIDNGWMSTFNPVPSLVSDVHFGLLMLGANDGGDTAGSANNVCTLADQWLALHPQGVLFVSNRIVRSFAATAIFNSTLASCVATRRSVGKNIVLVDNYSVITLADLYDGLHPGSGGNRKIADRWIAAIQPYLRR